MPLLLSGCFEQNIVLKQIDQFQDSVQSGAEATLLYYRELNAQDRRLYLLLVALNPDCAVSDKFVDSNCKTFPNTISPTPLSESLMPPASLKVRMDLLSGLATYAETLGKLAKDSSPEDFSKNVDEVQTRFKSLETNFNALNQSASRPRLDSEIGKNYVAPLSAIVSILGQEYLRVRKWQTVRVAVIQAQPSVNKLLDSLKKDLAVANVIVPASEDTAYQNLVFNYNAVRKTIPIEKRRQLLSEIEITGTKRDLLRANNPAEVIQAMEDAHEKLVYVARDGGTPSSIASLKAALTIYVERVLALKHAIQVLTSNQSSVN